MSEHELWNELGNLYFMAGAYNQAIHAYERSIQADTNFGRPYSNLALTYVQQGKYDEAIELYRRSIELLAENKERAISWNRLGTVYRHLKDYSRAVIAFQEADLLDPHSADDFPAAPEARQQVSEPPSSVLEDPVREPDRNESIDEPELPAQEPGLEVMETELSLDEPEPLVEADASPAECEPATEAEQDGEPELEWWDVDEARMQSATARDPIASLPSDGPNTSWTPADPSQFQQDLSQMPETGSLTTWGDGDFDDDFEFFPSIGGDHEQDLPDPDAERIATWIPLPEEAPVNMDELWIPPFVEEEEPEPDFSLEWNEAPAYHTLNSVDFGSVPPSDPRLPEPIEYLPRSASVPVRQAASQQTWDQLDVDVALEERNASDIALGTQQSSQPLAPLTVQELIEQEVAEPEPAAEAVVAQEMSEPDVVVEQTAQEVLEPDVVVEETVQEVLEPEMVVEETVQEVLEPEMVVEQTAQEVLEPNVVVQEPTLESLVAEGVLEQVVSEPEPAAEQVSPQALLEEDVVVQEPILESLVPQEMSEQVVTEPEPAPEAAVAEQAVEQEPVEPEAVIESPLVQEALDQEVMELEPPEAQEALEQEIMEEQPLAEPSVNAQPPALPDCERAEDETREIEMGIAKFRRVVQVNPRNAHAWDALGTLYKAAGLYKDAILAYQQAISNDSSKSLYYHHLGLVYACEGRDGDAIGAFQRVLEIDPEYSLAHATLGGYYRKMGLEELAQKHIGKAMKNIFDSENEYNRACLEAICGNADQAIALLGVALKNKQTYVDWILRDPDLDFIRQDPRFKQLISDYTR